MLTIIVAMSRNFVIGSNNALPWDIPADLRRFKKLTTGHVVVMGRKTYESLGRLLPQRHNIILSSTLKEEDIPFDQRSQTPFTLIKDMNQWKSRYDHNQEKQVYIIGGGEIYKQFLPLVDDMQLTLVEQDIQWDTFFPSFDWLFEVKELQTIASNSQDTPTYSFIHYTKIVSWNPISTL